MTAAVSTSPSPLTDRQELFVREYLVDLNASAAARRAGYSPKNNGKQSSEMLKDPRIRERVREGLEALYEKVGLNAITALRGLVNVAFFDARKMVGADGRVLALHEMDEDTATTLVVSALPDKEGEVRMRMRQPPRVAALITLLKRFDREREFMQPWNEPAEAAGQAAVRMSEEEQQARIEAYDRERAAWGRRPSAETGETVQMAQAGPQEPVEAQARAQAEARTLPQTQANPQANTPPQAQPQATRQPLVQPRAPAQARRQTPAPTTTPAHVARRGLGPGPEESAARDARIAEAARLQQAAWPGGPTVGEVEEMDRQRGVVAVAAPKGGHAGTGALAKVRAALAGGTQSKAAPLPAAGPSADKPVKRRPWGLLWGEMEGFFSKERVVVNPPLKAGEPRPWEKTAGGPKPPGIVKERPRFAVGGGEFEWSDDYLAWGPYEKV